MNGQPPLPAVSERDRRNESGTVLDLFSGPRGWDVAAKQLGLDPLGIETDDAACATSRAAGFRTAQYDVARYLDERYYMETPLRGLIASPPCQTFSMAGKGAGRDALDQVLRGIQRVAMGDGIDYGNYEDARTGLVLEPLRYALETGPEWMAWEQVPTVQPVWNACADVLRADGYSVWTGHLHAEQYGVPQTRKRSVLLASRTHAMARPEPTHSRFYPSNPGKLDMGVQKWVSMADALGWDPTTRVISNYGTGGDPRNRGERTADQPSATITSKVDRNIVLRNNTSTNAAERHLDEPAPTLYFGARMNGVYWQQARNSGPGATRTPRGIDEPSYTIRANGSGSHPSGVEWHRNGEKVRVTVQEAAILQSFPADYPWQGTKTKQYQQVGNAIPPGLALHVLAAALGVAVPVASEVAA